MRTFHYKRNPDFCPSINVDRLWSMVPEGVYEKAKTDSNMAPVIDVTKLVSHLRQRFTSYCDPTNSESFLQGYFKVLGKGNLPSIPLVVKAKFFSKEVCTACYHHQSCATDDILVILLSSSTYFFKG
jgi:large subunit ribosomal protein L27Ae